MSFYYSFFFRCKDCGFMFSLLGQADKEIEGCCPSCGECDLDYAPKRAREKYIQSLKNELSEIEIDD